MDFRTLLRWILDPWVILGAIVFGVALLGATLFLMWLLRPPAAATGLQTAVVSVVSMPTATQPPPTLSPTEVVTPTTTPPPVPTGSSEDIPLDAFVEITGTGTDGLRLRVDPGLDSEVRLLGLESEVFQVKDGPKDVDGYRWYYLVAPADETRRGWAVSNYLTVVQNP
jgi:hypothetical protein